MKTISIPLTIAWIFAALPLHARDTLVPPPNKPATVKWDAKKGQLRILYGQDVIMDAAVTAVDGNGGAVENMNGGLDQKKLDQVLAVWAKKNLVDYGYKILQIDAGWSTGQGPEGLLNWNDRFPGGPQRAVERIRKIGMTPGLHTWVVFRPGDKIVDDLVKEHPDWFLQKPDGSVLNKGTYTLNPFNEDALDRLIRPTYKGLKEQGWEYIKIDGQGNLMAWGYSEYPEHFKKLKTTPAEALRKINRTAREELGDGLFILGCWSVRPELIGIIDGCRLGRDAFGPAELQYFNSWNGVVWRNDPDHCDIAPSWLPSELPWFMESVDKNPEGPNPDTIVRPCVVSMAGGMLMLSDKAEVYNNDKNLEGLKRSSPVRFSDLGLSDKKEYLVYEFWSRQFLGRKKHAFVAPLQTPGNGLQVFSIREAREHPWVIPTSRHISQGGVDLMNLRWDANKHTLAGESAVVKKDPYQIAVYLPKGYGFLDMESSGADPEIKEYDAYITATLVPTTTGTIGCSMTFVE